jgi:steroid 5-alpha reductase family enzyme
MVQGLWVYCISTPLLLVVSSSSSSSSNSSINSTNTDSWLNICLLLGMMKSIIVQITSDISKSIWVSRGRIGGFCTDGFWYISRHPNYTGEIFTWIFASLYSMSVNEFSITSIIVASISPLFTVHILCNTSATGVWNAEGKNLKRYYEHSNKDVRIQYNIYRMTTAPLYPNVFEFLIPYEQLPISFKRWFYFEWERYEYKENKKK